MVADASENGDFVTLEWFAVVVLNQRKSQKRKRKRKKKKRQRSKTERIVLWAGRSVWL